MSFPSTRNWTDIVVPFDLFRSVGAASDGHLDLDEIAHIFFMLDTWNTRPGTAGTVEIEGLSVRAHFRRRSEFGRPGEESLTAATAPLPSM